MESELSARGAAERTTGTGFDRDAAITRSLLGYGMVAGPFYVVVGLIQALVRDGFDLTRHPLSLLANGPGGWVQTANFVVTGLMVVAAAVGFYRVLGPENRGVSWFLSTYGMSMLIASIFSADPMDGFPPGTPEGLPATLSTSGLVHFAAGGVGFLALGLSCFVAWLTMARRGARPLAYFSLAAGVVVLLGFFGGPALSTTAAATLGIWVSVLVGWVWLAVLSRHLYRVSPDPNCAT